MTRGPRVGSERARSLLLGATGLALFFALWEIVGRLRLLGMSCPPPSDVLAVLADPARTTLFSRALGASMTAFAAGYAAGWIAGIGTAILAHVARPLRPGLDRLSTFIHAIPSIALAPVLIVLLGRESTPAALAGVSTFFALYVATSSGLASVRPALRDVMTVNGAGWLTQLLRLDLPMALPALVGGARLAAPSALIGVIVGEWFGAPRGLGVVIINAMQNFQIALLWSVVVLTVCVSLVLYGLLGLVQAAAAERFR